MGFAQRPQPKQIKVASAQLAGNLRLEAIYEADFLDCSCGFRPGRNCHQAINAVDKAIMTKPIGYVIEADIESHSAPD